MIAVQPQPGIAARRASIFGISKEELTVQLASWGEPGFRAIQVLEWVYRKRLSDWGQMTNLPERMRARLAEGYSLGEVVSVGGQGSHDTTRKYLFRLRDGRLIESVVIPANPALYGEGSDRHTLCVSTQVGCAMACGFCASGLNGLTRNLEAHEIVEQVVEAERLTGERMDNLVFMGMGEPLANYQQVMRALTILNAPWGVGIGARHMTLSTSGLVPQIRRLAAEKLPVRLAVSLHGATDEVREKIMPINRKYPLGELIPALEDYVRAKRQVITLEYILIEGVNASLEDANALARMAQRLKAKVNLIPYNSVDGLLWARPEESLQDEFLSQLRRHGVTATLRREKGHDIEAACGQLRLREEATLHPAGMGTTKIEIGMKSQDVTS
ncbi:MAG: 23S rRNA (adenine(2503)-C(2))-methyltransferase RlmN [Verrucomicrobiales bacterium]